VTAVSRRGYLPPGVAGLILALAHYARIPPAGVRHRAPARPLPAIWRSVVQHPRQARHAPPAGEVPGLTHTGGQPWTFAKAT
jgi:hypothetical protein